MKERGFIAEVSVANAIHRPIASIPDLAVPRVARRLRRAYLAMCRCGDAVFAPYGMTTDQYALMRVVLRSKGIKQSELGAEIFAGPNTVSAMVSLLVKRGILRRVRCSEDGRAWRLYATPAGKLLMKRLFKIWEPTRQRLNDCFSGGSGKQALEILDRVHEEMVAVQEEVLQKPARTVRSAPRTPVNGTGSGRP